MIHVSRFSKIYMHGFKSFQKKTQIPLFDGFNAVIGPNGSGKSNLLDALVFVMGSSSRFLRAGKMDHIIYNGGHGKKPSDYAKVSLIINNEDKIIPDMPNEIEIARRVNRKGQSIYRINDKVTSKIDVIDLLNKTGFDPEGHSIIQQGDVTQIIEMKSKERREVVDRVAGIKEYNEKKLKALLELEQAEKNLNDAKLVMEQKFQHLKRLKDQKEAAEKVQETQKQLDEMKARLSYTKLSGAEGALENLNRNLGIKEQELASMKSRVTNFDTDLDSLQADRQKLEETIIKKSVNASLRADIEVISTDLIRKEQELKYSKEEIERLRDTIATVTSIGKSRGMDVENEAVKSVLKEVGAEGTIASLGRIEPKYAVAFEVAYGGHKNDVIVGKEDQALDGIDFLKSRGLGRVRFLPLDRLRPFSHSAKAEIASKMPGIIGMAIELVKFGEKHRLSFQHVLQDTLIAEDVESARKVKGLKVVTLSGELFDAGGAIVGGTLHPKMRIQAAQTASDMSRIEQYELEVAKLEQKINDLEPDIDELTKQLAEKRKMEKQEGSDVLELQKKKKEIEENVEEMKRSRKGTYEQRESFEAEVNQLRVTRARVEAEVENLRIDFEKYKELQGLEEGDPVKLDLEIRKLERTIRNAGPVNMMAVEEYEKFAVEYESFQKKVEKLAEESNSIQNMIAQIEEKRKELFYNALSTIREEFQAIFKDLAEGEADLEMENKEDIESGLVIKAQPKSKKLLSIDSLSGGEKTITALAFLFAIQRYKPSPFYILDEIDAALDHKNSEKVGDLIRKYAASSQFLVISHNDVTVRRASKIYGVSMQQGVSQVMGVDMANTPETIEAPEPQFGQVAG